MADTRLQKRFIERVFDQDTNQTLTIDHGSKTEPAYSLEQLDGDNFDEREYD